MKTCIETEDEELKQAAVEQILVATDLTDTDDLLPQAIAQAKRLGAHVRLIHALQASDVRPLGGLAIPYLDRSKILRDRRVALLGLIREFESQGISCDSAVLEGDPCDVLCEEMDRIRPSRLIMGSREKVDETYTGSLAQTLVTKSDVPIFVAGARVCRTRT